MQNYRIISILLLTSQLLVIVQCAGSNFDGAACRNNKGITTIKDDKGVCRCSVHLPPDDGYSYVHGGSAYAFHNERKTWNEARLICEEEGSHLAVLESDLERRVLLDLMEYYLELPESYTSRPENHVWLGIHDQFQEGDWSNVFGEPLSYAPWAPRDRKCASTQQPNGGTTSNCGTLVRKCNYMDDLNCKWKLPFFCERPHKCLE